jgi:hypothetical protein
MKTGLGTLGTAENESENTQKKTGPDAIHYAESVSGIAKHEIRT